MDNIDLNALFKMTYGLYVISSAFNNKCSGFVGNAVMQLSPDPVRIAVCSSKNNFTTELIQKSNKLSVSILNNNNSTKEIIGKFGYKSGKEIDKFAGLNYFLDDGIPVLKQNAIAWLTGEVVESIELDSHFLFIVLINKCEFADYSSQPITYEYYRDVFKGVSPKNAPTYIDHSLLKNIEDVSNDIWVCDLCKYEYNQNFGDPDSGIPAGTKFEDLPDDWVCPVCARSKGEFSQKNKKNINKLNNTIMDSRNEIWVCEICGYEYDPTVGDVDGGIAPGTAFEDIPDDWMCPICGVGKSDFKRK